MSYVKETLAKYQSVTLRVDDVPLTADIKAALPFLQKAFEHIDRIYRGQLDEALPALYDQVMRSDTEEMKDFFRFFNGPWNPQDEFQSAHPEAQTRKKGCAFYPADLTKEEWDAVLAKADKAEQAALISEYTVIRRRGGKLVAIPFHEEYATELKLVGDYLRQAADKIEHKALAEFIRHRAQALQNGDYRAADERWVRLKDTPLEIIIGPYEVYEDNLFNLKASYEAFLMAVDVEKAERLHQIADNLSLLSAEIPLPNGSKASVGGMAPMVVVHQLGSAGEARQGVNAAAFNLPNDSWVRGHVGWKQVMIYNVMQAKFNHCTRKIGEVVLEDGGEIEFEPYFYSTILHEVTHGLGPSHRATGESISKCMGTFYTAIEEAKADTGGLYLILKKGGSCGIPAFESGSLLRDYVAGLFRSMRFGVHEAHGRANVIQFNWMRKHGVLQRSKSGRFSVDASNLTAVTLDSPEIMMQPLAIEQCYA